MSVTALVDGCVAALRDALGDPDGKFVGEQAGARPPANFGQWYVGLDDNGWQNRDQNPLSLDEVYAVLVVVTFRLNYAPRDRQATEADRPDSLEGVVRKVILTLHASYDVLARANASLGISVNGFVEPLRLSGVGGVKLRGAEWVGARSGKATDVHTRELRFAGARRIQKIESMT